MKGGINGERKLEGETGDPIGGIINRVGGWWCKHIGRGLGNWWEGEAEGKPKFFGRSDSQGGFGNDY